MILPELNNVTSAPISTGNFLGINRNHSTFQDGEFREAINLSTDHYPAAGNREGRYQTLFNSFKYGYCVVDNDIYSIYRNSDNTYSLLKNLVEVANIGYAHGFATVRKLILIGANIAIYPDGIIYNTKTGATEDWNLQLEWRGNALSTSPVTFAFALENYDTPLRPIASSADNTTAANNGTDPSGGARTSTKKDYYYTRNRAVAQAYATKGLYSVLYYNFDDAVSSYYMQEYSPENLIWTEKPVYLTVKLMSTNAAEKETLVQWRSVIGKYIESYVKTEFRITGRFEDLAILNSAGNNRSDGNYDLYIKFSATMTDRSDLFRLLKTDRDEPSVWESYNGWFGMYDDRPDMEYVITVGNRVWGCSPGKNEIYASKLGYPMIFNEFVGRISDSYAATVGSIGEFTGAVVYGDHPLFFKEDRIIQMYGNRPANYQLQEIECDGLEDGASKTAIYLNDYVYYKSKQGVMRFAGDFPVLLSKNINIAKTKGIVAGACKNKYYIVIKKDEAERLYVLDAQNGLWMEESNDGIKEMFTVNGNLYANTETLVSEHGGTTKYYYLRYMNGATDPDNFEIIDEWTSEEKVEWSFETDDLISKIVKNDPGTINKSKLKRFYVTFELDQGASCKCFVAYDNENSWTPVFNKRSKERKTYSFPILPKRSQKIRLKMEGSGDFRLYQIIRVMGRGGINGKY